MKSSVTKNYIYNLAFQILSLVFPIITTPYLARVLGAEQIGVFCYTYSIVTYFVLFASLGITLYGQREIAYVQDNKQKRSKAFYELICVRIITIFVMLTLFIIFSLMAKEYKIYYFLWIFELIASLFDISWYFQGMQQFKKIIFRNLLIKIISIICIFLFVKSSKDLYIYILIYAVTTLIGNLSLWLYLPKSIDFKLVGILNFSKLWVHVKNLFVLFIPQIATQVYTMLDKTMIGIIITNKSEVGFYEQAQKVVYILLSVLTSLGTVLMPRIASYFYKNDKTKIKQAIYKSFNFVFMIGLPLMCGSILIAKYLIPILLGEEYTKSILLMQMISPIILFVGLSNITGIQLLIPLKRQKQYNYSIIVGAVINLILNIFFIKYLAAVGATITTVIAELVILIIQLCSVKDIVDIKQILRSSKNYLIGSGVMVCFCCILINILKTNDYIMLSALVVLGVTSYFASLLLLNDKYFKDILVRFKVLRK